MIGSGIAGLASAYFLRRRFDLTVFERNGYAGGHSNTVMVREGGAELPVDTGFMVFNHPTYPNLQRLFAEVGVETRPTDMSFSVQYRPRNLEFSGSSLNHLFAQRRNLFNPRYIRMLLQVNRFNEEAVQALADPRYETYTLGRYVSEKKYGDDFLDCYLAPMSSAVWSTPPGKMLEFPAVTLLRFFHNHGFLGLHTQHPWRTVAGGARAYVRKLTADFAGRIRLGSKVVSVRREAAGAKVSTADGFSGLYDCVILASHADESLRMLEDATPLERKLLSPFKYQYNRTLLHTDASVMPRARLAWSSWNYRVRRGESGELEPSTHYWMNRLQGVSNRVNYFVSLGDRSIDPAKVIREIDYHHPLFDLEAAKAQKNLSELNTIEASQSTYFCGSYFRYGFHEDALTSALELCRTILKEPLWNA